MPDLSHALQDRDLGFLRILAEAWGFELTATDTRSALDQVVQSLCDPERINEVLESLSPQTCSALEALQGSQGRLAWAEFIRRFGEVREMGPGRRDRERPDRNPISTAETLWYHSLVARGFFDTPTGPVEFAFIPDDLATLLPSVQSKGPQPAGQPALQDDYAHAWLANDRILDEACTLLAALRMDVPYASGDIPLAALQILLAAAGLLDEQNLPQPEPTRLFLEAPRNEALLQLFQAWKDSSAFNELRLTPGLVCEGQWLNDPLLARQPILELVQQLPAETWWDLEAFIQSIHQSQPDFQRPAGDYDSWFIRQADTGQYLRGFEHWEAVEGALLRFLFTGPLHWLGAVDLAAPTPQARPAAIRVSRLAASLFAEQAPSGLPAEDGKLRLRADGRIRVPRLTPRAVRYQVARFCDWEESLPDEFRYRVTPGSLERARKQGLRPTHLLSLLRRHAASPPAPTLVRAIEHWDDSGTQAVFEQLVVLRVKNPEILAALRRSRAARFLGEPLGPTAVIVQPGAREKVAQALIDLGYLAEASFGEGKGL